MKIDHWDALLQVPLALSLHIRHPASYCMVQRENVALIPQCPRSELPECLAWSQEEVESIYRLVTNIGLKGDQDAM